MGHPLGHPLGHPHKFSRHASPLRGKARRSGIEKCRQLPYIHLPSLLRLASLCRFAVPAIRPVPTMLNDLCLSRKDVPPASPCHSFRPRCPTGQHHGKMPRNTPVSLQGKPCGQTRRKTRPYPPANPRPTHGQPTANPRPTHGQTPSQPPRQPPTNPRPTHGQPTAKPPAIPPTKPPANPRRPTRFASRLAPTWQGAPLRH